MQPRFILVGAFLATWTMTQSALGQAYSPPDRDAPGDAMIQQSLARQAERIDGTFFDGWKAKEDWDKLRPQWKQEYLYMLGLWPLPERTPLEPKVTGRIEGDGYVVELLHYQSRPRLYVTGNLYRPAKVKEGERLPAVLYVCGHSNQGRDGNKTAYQSHGIWFARHGYVCLVLDSLQLGEIAAIHHGTYREGRWWWHSRGYTPAGVECWNGVRGVDYLISRPEVDPQRIAVTGISGGGAATFWIAAADERVKVAVPVSGMADLQSYVSNRVINGHCDCMFLYNTFQWPWTRIAALICPRPMLFVNSDHDTIFPMDANERIINRLERVYSLFGATDLVDAVVSMGGHAYRKDIRQAAFRFINMQLKDDPRIVTDSEVDVVAESGEGRRYAIPPEKLRVFPKDSDLPKDELNTTIDRHFVPVAKAELPEEGKFDVWKAGLVAELRRVALRPLPGRVPAAKLVKQVSPDDALIETEPGIELHLRYGSVFKPVKNNQRIVLVVRGPEDKEMYPEFVHRTHDVADATYVLSPRGADETRWTRKNPPNYVERSHVLLGRTVDEGRVWDVIAAARYLKALHEDKLPVVVLGQGAAGVVAAYAALCELEIAGAILNNPPLSHMDDAAPQLLNVLRVCDVPEVLGMLAPRPLTIYGVTREKLDRVTTIYARAGQPERLSAKEK